MIVKPNQDKNNSGANNTLTAMITEFVLKYVASTAATGAVAIETINLISKLP